MSSLTRTIRKICVPNSSWEMWAKAAELAGVSKIALIISAVDYAAMKIIEKKGGK